MDLKAYPLEPAEKVTSTPGMRRVQGVIKLPQGSKIVHIGAAPPEGGMYAYAEVSPMNLPTEEVDIMILQPNDEIPMGYEYLGYILAVPILFVYRRKPNAIMT